MPLGKKIIPVVVGPTASGKSDLARRLAFRFGYDVASMDSMKVYRGMDIGTAKPAERERRETRYHFIDLIDASESFDTARFFQEARRLMSGPEKILVEGGTALYLKSLLEGIFPGPKADWPLREELEARAAREGVGALHRELSEIDPAAAARIRPEDLRRVIRALEVHRLTGSPISTLQEQGTHPPEDLDFHIVGISRARDELVDLIDRRVEMMFEEGLVQEVRALLSRGPLSREASQALGYKEVISHLDGAMTLDECVERVKIGTRQFSRRQMNWYKRWKQIQWICVSGPIGEAHAEQAARLLGMS